MPDYTDDIVQGDSADELVGKINFRLSQFPSVELFYNEEGKLVLRTWYEKRPEVNPD